MKMVLVVLFVASAWCSGVEAFGATVDPVGVSNQLCRDCCKRIPWAKEGRTNFFLIVGYYCHYTSPDCKVECTLSCQNGGFNVTCVCFRGSCLSDYGHCMRTGMLSESGCEEAETNPCATLECSNASIAQADCFHEYMFGTFCDGPSYEIDCTQRTPG